MRRVGHVKTRRGVSLDRALSKLGAASRTDARALVVAGRVRVDGRVVTNPAAQVVPEIARITVDGTVIERRPWRLIAFHKPRGVITTRRDPAGRSTIFDVLGAVGAGLIAVGRLDVASTGLLLLTNDTQLANRLTDPRSGLTRRYVVTVRGRVDSDAARRLERGIETPTSDRGAAQLRAVRVFVRKASGRETHLIVDLDEGKNREVRRLLAAVGHEVTHLHRVAFGPIALGRLPPGAWREVNRKELEPWSRPADRRGIDPGRV